MTDVVKFFGNAVAATDKNGSPIFVNGQRLLIPDFFSLQSQINAAHYQSTRLGIYLQEWFGAHYAQGAGGDPQRQAGYSGGFDPTFTDAGNYAFGLSAAAAGYSLETALKMATGFNNAGTGKSLPPANVNAITQAFGDYIAGRFGAPNDASGATYANSVFASDLKAAAQTYTGFVGSWGAQPSPQKGGALTDAQQYALATWGDLNLPAATAFIANFQKAFASYPRHLDISQLQPLAGDGSIPGGKDVILFVGEDGAVLAYLRPPASTGAGALRGIYGLDVNGVSSASGTGLNFFNDGTPQPISVQQHLVTPDDPTGGIDVTLGNGTKQHWWYDKVDGFVRANIDRTLPVPAVNGVKRTENSLTFPTGDGDAGVSVGLKATYGDGTTANFDSSDDFQRYQTLQNQGAVGESTNGGIIDQARLQQIVQSLVSQPAGPIDNSLLTVNLTNLGVIGQSGLGSGGDGTPFAGNNVIYAVGGVVISAAGQAGTDLASLSSSSIANALYRPYYQSILSAFNNIPEATDWLNTSAGSTTLPASQVPYWALTGSNIWTNPTPSFTDPLLLDLTGAGIGVSSWIKSPVYFDTNVVPDANGNPTTTPDGLQHQTAWMQAGTAMLVFEASGTVKPITNITQTVSQFLNAGPTPAKYADGLAALASLVKIDPATGKPYTVFSAQTAAIDSTTGVSYWNEIMVWNDANHNGVSDAGEIVSLDSLGITSISLLGSGNQGESINGSVVTNRTTYSKSDGTTGQAAAVNFQNNSIGAVVSTGSGGEIVTSLSEGGPTKATTFVAENSSGHSYTIQNGKLTDTTTGQVVVASGITAALSLNQNDVITVAASDTGTYWLGGGTGADILTGGGGTNVFLVNPTTVVHGGTGANSFNIAKVIGSQGVTIDMAKANLQEVIGGVGGDIINASGTSWNVFIQAGGGNGIIIGGAASAAISGGTGDDLIELGSGGGVVHAGRGNDVIYGGAGTTNGKPNSDVIFAGPGHDIVNLGTNNAEVYAGSGTLTVIGNANGFSVVGFHGSYADYTLTHNADGTITVTNINNMDGDGPVTMKNVTDLDFKDISQVPVTSTAGMPVSDRLYTANPSQVTINASGQYIIAASTLLANDINYAGNPLSIRELLDIHGNVIARGASGQANGGTVALSSDGATITFTPAAGFGGVPSFRYHVVDSKGNNGAFVQQVGTSNTAEMTGTVYLNTPDLPTDALFDSEWFLSSANVIPVWKDYTGAGVNVAVFDPSGNVDFSNPDLAPNAGRSVKLDGTPGVQQIGTHATLVAGVIAASRDGRGTVGVAYDATVSSVALPQSSNINALGILNHWSDYDVIDNSWTISPPFVDSFLANPNYQQLYINAVSTGRGGLGTILVFAGGNDRTSGRTTQDLNETNSLYGITVGGINATTDLGSLVLSGRPFSEPGSSILVSAPANNITSTGTTFTNQFGQQFGANTQITQGTSFAAPIVSGVVALMLQANPNLGYRDVQQILAYSARKVNDPTPTSTDPYNTWSTNNATNWNGGGLHYSLDYGYGEVDARAAVRLAETWQAQQTQANLIQSAWQTPSIQNLPVSVTPSFVQNPDGTIGFGSYTYQYGYFSVASGVPNQTIEHVEVAVDLDLTIISLPNTQIVLGRLTSRQPYNLWGHIATVYGLSDTSIILSGETAAPGNVITEADGHQHLVFTYDTLQYMGESSYSPLGWALAIVNTQTQQAIVTTPPNWQIRFDGSSSSDPKQWIFTDEYAGGATITPVTATDSFNAAAATGNDIIDLRSGTSDSMIDGKAVTVSGNLAKGFGGDGNDTLIANNGGDFLYGGRGNDTLIGGTGNDTLDGGQGNDTLIGGGGIDTYKFSANYGQDVIVNGVVGNAGPSGQLVLGAGLTASRLWFAKSGNDLVVQVIGTTSQVTLRNWFSASYAQVSSITLADGSQIGTGAITALANAMAAYQASSPAFNVQSATALPVDAGLHAAVMTNWSRAITGTVGNDFLDDGGIGNNTLVGGGGSDTYGFKIGYGQEVIVNGLSSNNGPSGQLVLGPGLTPGNLWLARSGNDLVVEELGTTNQVTVSGWFSNAYSELQSVVAGDGSTIGTAALTALQSAMAAYQAANPGFNPQAAGQGMPPGLASALANGWNITLVGTTANDTLDPGGSGNDTLVGNGGNDVYKFNAGYGQDVIVNGNGIGGASGELVLGAGLAPSSLWFSQAGNDLVVGVLGTTSSMTVRNWFASSSGQLQTILAGDGSTIGPVAVAGLVAAMASYRQNNAAFDPRTATAMPAALQGALASQWIPPGPTLTVQGASGSAGTVIPLSITATPTALEVPSSLSITISGVPAVASLSAGTKNADGSWTLTPAQLSGLTLTTPAGSFSGVASLTVTATATAQSGGQQSTSATISVAIAGVATAPTLTVQNDSGNAGTTIPLAIASALTATDGTESLSVRVTGVPNGANLSAGTRNADGSWTLTAAQLSGLALTAPAGSFAGTANLTIVATAIETNGSTASTSASLAVAITGVAAAPTLSVQNVSGNAGSAIALNIASALTATDGTESLSITIGGMPSAATLSAGTKNADGSWTLTPAQLAGLTLTAPAGTFAGTAHLTVTATAIETSGSAASTTAALAATIAGVATAPTLTVQNAAGNAGTAIALNIASALTATDGAESLSISIGGVPSAAALSAGTKNADGSWTLTPAQLAGLTLTVPAGSFAGTLNLTVTATAAETDGSTASTVATIAANIAGVATAPTLTVQNAAGNAGSPIALHIASALTATDGAESLSIMLSGVPGVATLSAGTKNADGSWTLTPAQLAGLTLMAPAGSFAGTANLTVTATAIETNGSTASATTSLAATIAGVATAPTLTVQNASGNAGSAIALNIASALTATDGTEALSLSIAGLPAGASLSAGTKNADGSWTLTPAQLTGLTLTAPAGSFAGTANLTVTATATEADGSTASATASLAATIAGVATAPTLSVQNAAGNAGSAIALNIASALTATDGTESLSIAIAGVPSVATLSAGTKNADGSWTLTSAQLAGLTLTTPAGSFAGTANLTVTATAIETNGSHATTTATLPVAIAGVATAPTLALQSGSAAGGAISLNIVPALTAIDGTEVLSVKIAGLPNNVTPSAGVRNADGSWTLTPAQLAGLTLSGPAGAFTGIVTVTAIAQEQSGSQALTSASFSLGVGAGGNQVLSTAAAHVLLQAGAGNDTLTAAGSSETLLGGSGAATLISNAAGNTLQAGAGTAIASYSANNMKVNLANGTAAINGTDVGDKLIGITVAMVSGTNDTLIGGNESSTLIGWGANNTLLSLNGLTTLVGNVTGNTLWDATARAIALYEADGLTVDLTTGFAAANGSDVKDTIKDVKNGVVTGNSDTLIGYGVLRAAGHTDTLIGSFGGATLISNVGNNVLVANDRSIVAAYELDNVTVDLSAGTAVVNGTSSRDTLVGFSIAKAFGRNDTLVGGPGLTTLSSNGAGNTLQAGAGQTTAFYSGISGGLSVDLTKGTAGLSGSGVYDRLIGINNVIVSGSNAVLIAGAQATTLTVYNRNNTLIGGSGISTLVATARGAIGNTLVGGSGLTTFLSNMVNNTLVAGAGTAIASYSGSNLAVNLAAGTAMMNGSSTSDTLIGISVIVASGSNDTLTGGAGTSTLTATGTGSTLIGGSGLTTLASNAAGNTLEAGAGTAIASYSGNGITVDLAAGRATTAGSSTGDRLVGMANATIAGNNNTLVGGAGSSTLTAAGSGNTLIGGAGMVTLGSSGGGNTLKAGSGGAIALYRTSNLLIDLTAGTAKANGASTGDTLLGIAGVRVAGSNNTLTTNGSGNVLQSDSGSNTLIAYGAHDTLQAGAGSDVLSASGSNDVLIGGSGVSTLVAYGSNDTLIGGSGTTTFVGNAAGNTLQAGSGTSTLLYGANGLTVNLSAGTAKLNGASIGDTLVGLSSIIYSGSNGTLIGSNGANVLAATGAGDTLIAGSGANTLVGYGANEVLIGGSGTNTLVAAGVSDTLVAGSGGGVLRNFGALGAYDFNAGSGSAIIINGQSSGSSASNELDFGTGISDSQLWFVQSGSDLQIDLMGTSKQVTVKGWFSSAGSQLQEITAGGLKLDNQVSQLVQAMATYSAGHTGFDPSIVTQMPNDPTLQGAVAAAWHS